MALQLFKEQLNGKYDGVTAPTLLPVGGVSDGENMRKISYAGGWKPRRGVTHHNTTQVASESVLSLHQYTHPRVEDYHFLAQINGNLYDATNDPPASGTTYGSSISTDISSTLSGFSDTVGDMFLYADGSGRPLLWGGDEPFTIGFAVWDNTTTSYVDYTRDVRDNRLETSAVVLAGASDKYYVCSPEIAEGIKLDLGAAVNSNAVTATVKSWVAGAWADRTATDGTADSGKTHAVDGSLTWTRNSTDTMRVVNGIMGYWYEVSWSGAMSGSVDVISCQVNFDMSRMSNKWSGVYQQPLSVRWHDNSVGHVTDISGKLTNESTSQYHNIALATTSDEFFVKSDEPLTGIGFGVVDGFENTANAQVDDIQHWDGDGWVSNTIQSDETLDTVGDTSFAQTGTIWWNAAGDTVKRKSMDWDSLPAYWYRVQWDAAPDNTDSDVRIYFVAVATFPEELPAYDGVIEFKGRAFLWGDPEFPNRLRYSAKDRPDSFSGADSGYTDAFGDTTKVNSCVRFYNELIVTKENSVWLLEGYSPETFGNLRIADTVGCASPKTLRVLELGSTMMHQDEGLSVALWQDTDGVYALDGRKPKKISLAVDHYFNTEYASTVIAAADLKILHAETDHLNNEYHLLIPNGGSGHGVELVYNIPFDEWFPPWDRTVGGANDYIIAMLKLRGTDNRYYTYGGGSDGRVYRLENDTSDKNAADADVTITHSIKTRAFSVDQKQSPSLTFTFRKVYLEATARTTPATRTVETYFYKDQATSGTQIQTGTGAAGDMDLSNTGFNLVMDGLSTSQSRCLAGQLQFIADTLDLEMEIRSILYSLEALGEQDQ